MAITEEEANTEIANMALSKIGQYELVNIIEDSQVGRYCRLFLPQVRRHLLREHAWNFATLFAQLPPNTVTNEAPWEYRYKMPDNYLQLLNAWHDNERCHKIDRFNIAGRSFYVDEPLVWIEYIGDMCNPNGWEPNFTECVILKLAAELAIPITGNAGLRNQFTQELRQIAIPEAHLSNAVEDSSNENSPMMDLMRTSEYLRQHQADI